MLEAQNVSAQTGRSLMLLGAVITVDEAIHAWIGACA
jgi:hypothetical protein